MKCPDCQTKSFQPQMTRKGVRVERCEQCGGVWLEEGTIFHFAKRSGDLTLALKQGQEKALQTERLSPKTGEPLMGFPLPGEMVVVNTCTQTGGIWLGGREIEKLYNAEEGLLSIQFSDGEDEPEESMKSEPPVTGFTLGPLPNLYLRSATTLVLLYACLGLLLISAVEFAGLSPELALLIGVSTALVQFLVSPFIMDISLRWFYSMRWVTASELPGHLNRFVMRTSQQSGMRFPRFGIIEDGAPNAFTYGHVPNNARIVITRGILDLLDEREVEAVVAHEIGHAKHWDMLLMTVAQLVPLISYYVYRTLMRLKIGSGKDGKAKQIQHTIAIGAFLVYIVSEYVVLWFSRTREYYADRFAGEVTGRPNDLASALVKIAYGLAGQDSGKKGENEGNRQQSLEAVGAFGIFDPKVARSLALVSYGGGMGGDDPGGGIDKSTLLGAMRWDLWNPWARFYELHSTHPLTANRLTYLGDQASSMGQEPLVRFNLKKPESYWDEFFMDFAIYCLPFLALGAFFFAGWLTGQRWVFGAGMAFAGAGIFMKVFFSYPRKRFHPTEVSELLKEVKVSAVRSVPCSLKGLLIGRGVPGLIWSEDFVMRDKTGIMFLDYRQPSRIWEFFFGLLRGKEFQDSEVEITGWYRRSPIPYVELNNLRVGGETYTCYVYHVKLLLGALLVVAGLIYALGWFM